MSRIFFYHLSIFIFLFSVYSYSTTSNQLSISSKKLLEQASPHRSNWTPLTLQTFPNGRAAHILYFEPDKEKKRSPVKDVFFYAEGTVQLERDVSVNANGELISEGIQVEYYSSGAFKSIAAFHENLVDGPTFFYHPNGNQALQITYERNLPEGLSYMWDEEGNLLCEYHYFRGLLHNQGKTPAFQKFNKNHQIIEAQSYIYGQANGIHVCYDDDGLITYTVNYVKGKEA